MLTKFQKNALNAISSIGGIVYMSEEDKRSGQRCITPEGVPVEVINPDGRTFGRVGWPTINALVASGVMSRDHEMPSKYILNE